MTANADPAVADPEPAKRDPTAPPVPVTLRAPIVLTSPAFAEDAIGVCGLDGECF